jgi:hypothetical protein
MPQPLPVNPYNAITQISLHEAYRQCVMMETEAGGNGETLMLARCLGYLILELPGESNQVVAHEVVACNADFQEMAKLSHLYIDHLIRLCKSCFSFNHHSSLIHFLVRQTKGKTPAPSDHPSRPSFELHRAFFSEAVESAPRDHQSAKKSVSMLSNSSTPTLSYSLEGFKA